MNTRSKALRETVANEGEGSVAPATSASGRRGRHRQESVPEENLNVEMNVETNEVPMPERQEGLRPVDVPYGTLLTELRNVLREVVGPSREQPRALHATNPTLAQEHRKEPGFDKFLKQAPPTFSGEEEKARDFLIKIEMIIRDLGCSDAKAIYYAGRMMEGSALNWFTHYIAPNCHSMTWEQFVKLFTDMFVPPGFEMRKIMEFERLQRGDMSVEEYTTKFIQLSEYAAPLLANENVKNFHYVMGLGEPYTGQLIPQYAGKPFSAVVDVARQLEFARKRARTGSENVGLALSGAGNTFVMGSYTPGQESGRRSRSENRQRFGQESGSSRHSSSYSDSGSIRGIACQKCGKFHRGACYQDLRTCYNCHQPGHVIKDCPMFSGGQQSFSQSSMASVARPFVSQIPSQSGGQSTGTRGRRFGNHGRGPSFGFSRSYAGRGQSESQATMFNLNQRAAQTSNAVVAGTIPNCLFDIYV